MSITAIIAVLVAFQLKHFLADYPLQTEYMLGKSKEYNWEKPLLAHVAVHAIGTFAITCLFGVMHAVCFAVFDAAIHFVMDRFKADSRYLGRYKLLSVDSYVLATDEQRRNSKYYYYAFGLDQLVHHLTAVAIVGWMMFGG